MLKYYCVWLHKVWIYFLMIVTTAGIITAGAFLFYWLMGQVPIFKEIIIIKPTDTDGELIGESTASVLPGFITGVIGIVLGFWLESAFIARLRILKNFCGLRCCLLEQMRFVLHKLVVSKESGTINLYAIENVVSSPDSLAVLYSLPRYIKLPKYYGDYGEKFFDAARALNDYNKAVTEKSLESIEAKKEEDMATIKDLLLRTYLKLNAKNEEDIATIKDGVGVQQSKAVAKNEKDTTITACKDIAIIRCLEFMLAIDNKLLQQINGGRKQANKNNTNTSSEKPSSKIKKWLSKIKNWRDLRSEIKTDICKNVKILTRNKIAEGLLEQADNDPENEYVKAYCTLTDK